MGRECAKTKITKGTIFELDVSLSHFDRGYFAKSKDSQSNKIKYLVYKDGHCKT
jgi:hypothetical protein